MYFSDTCTHPTIFGKMDQLVVLFYDNVFVQFVKDVVIQGKLSFFFKIRLDDEPILKFPFKFFFYFPAIIVNQSTVVHLKNE